MADRRMRVCWQLDEALDLIADLELRQDVHRFPQDVQDVIVSARNAMAEALCEAYDHEAYRARPK